MRASENSAMLTRISVHGARQHNLKNIDVEIPRNTFTVITGLSGSGKSSLAFDTIYAEGQRRYVETLSPYARQFLDQMERPEVDSIDGLSPAISIEQKTTSRSPRSTVGTVTEIYDYLRVLYSSIGVPHCPSAGSRFARKARNRSSSRCFRCRPNQRVMILAPIVRGRKGEYKKELEKLARHGFVRARIDGELRSLDEADHTRQAQESHDRSRGRPSGAEARDRAARRGVGSDRDEADGRAGHRRRRRRRGADVLAETRLPELRRAAFRNWSRDRSPSIVRIGACDVCNGLGQQVGIRSAQGDC